MEAWDSFVLEEWVAVKELQLSYYDAKILIIYYISPLPTLNPKPLNPKPLNPKP